MRSLPGTAIIVMLPYALGFAAAYLAIWKEQGTPTAAARAALVYFIGWAVVTLAASVALNLTSFPPGTTFIIGAFVFLALPAAVSYALLMLFRWRQS